MSRWRTAGSTPSENEGLIGMALTARMASGTRHGGAADRLRSVRGLEAAVETTWPIPSQPE